MLIATIVALLLGAALTFGIVLPARRRRGVIDNSGSTQDIYGTLFIVIGIAPMSTVILLVFGFGALGFAWLLVDHVGTYLGIKLPQFSDVFAYLDILGVPHWIPLAAAFFVVYGWLVFINVRELSNQKPPPPPL